MLSTILRNSTSNWLVIYALLVFFTGFCASAFGAVPYRAKDVAVDENFQSVDRELKHKLPLSGGTITGPITVSSNVVVSGSITASSASLTSITASSATFSGLVVISSYSAATNGFTHLPGGLMLQWGTGNSGATSGSTSSHTFPKAFPTAAVSFSYVFSTSVIASNSNIVLSALSTTGFSTIRQNNGNADSFTLFYYMAIGY